MAEGSAVRKRTPRWLLGGIGAVLLVGGGVLIWRGAQAWLAERALQTDGAPGQASVVRRYRGDGKPRLEYSFVDSKGTSFNHDVAMDEAVWTTMAGATRVLIVYLPSDPSRSRLMVGEITPASSVPQKVTLGVLLLVLGAAGVTLAAKPSPAARA